MADIFGCIVKGIAQILGNVFLHVKVAILVLAGPVGRSRRPSIGQKFVRGVKLCEIAHFSKNYSGHTERHNG